MPEAHFRQTVARIASEAGLEPAALMAVCEVESGGRVFARIANRLEPVIRFEGHYFDRRLSPPKRRIARLSGLAAPKAGAIANPRGQAARWRMLERAASIDRKAAWESTSWGVGQVMGAHWAWLGYESIEALVGQVRAGAAGQLRLMVRYIEKARLADALRNRDWHAFARGYNGPAYRRYRYHKRIERAYRRHSAASFKPENGSADRLLRTGSRGKAVADLQQMLAATGYPLENDGVFGPKTREMVIAFQSDQRLAIDGIAGPQTLAALRRALPRPSRLMAVARRILNWFFRR